MIKINNELNIISTRLEIETALVFPLIELVGFLNQNSDGLTNQIGSGITTWNFEIGQGLKVVDEFIQITKNSPIAYRFLSNENDSLILEFIP